MEGLCFFGGAGDTFGAAGNIMGDTDCTTPPPTPGDNRMGGTGAIRKPPRNG